MEFTFRVLPDDAETYEVTAKSRDIVHWEKRFKRSLAAVTNDMSMAALTQLAYVAASRLGLTGGADYVTFESTVDIELVGDDEDDEDSPGDDGAGPTPLDR